MSINIPTAYKSSLDLPYGTLGQVIEWCKSNCVGDWKFSENVTVESNTQYDFVTHHYEYTFYFENERDFFAFTLWKK